MNYQTDQSASIGGNLNVGGRLTTAGNVVHKRNVRIEGWLDAPNLRSPCQGMFESMEALTAAYPEPRDGWWALIRADAAADGSLQATVCTACAGGWNAGKTVALDIDIDLSTKADKSMFVTLSEAEYDALVGKNVDTYYFVYED